MTWTDVERVCARERIALRLRQLPGDEKGWLVRVDSYVSIRLSRHLNDADRLWTALHELAHYFVDDCGEMAMCADNGARSEGEEFCETFAWYCVNDGVRRFIDRMEGQS